jgi:hypothetical protein
MSFLNISWVQASCLDSSISFDFKLRVWNLQYLSYFVLGLLNLVQSIVRSFSLYALVVDSLRFSSSLLGLIN